MTEVSNPGLEKKPTAEVLKKIRTNVANQHLKY